MGTEEKELDANLEQELEEKTQEKDESIEDQESKTESTEEQDKGQEAEPKTFPEEYVKKLRGEEARRRIENRQLREENQRLKGSNSQDPRVGNVNMTPGAGQQQTGPVFDPRVDDMLLASKLNEIKADPDISEIYDEVDEEGVSFEAKLLETAAEKQWPIDELDALALKMVRGKLFGKLKQKGVDEAYKTMSSKAQGSAEKNVSSGKSVEDGEVKTIDDGIKKAMKDNKITSLADLR